jgi:hypothetical protein
MPDNIILTLVYVGGPLRGEWRQWPLRGKVPVDSNDNYRWDDRFCGPILVLKYLRPKEKPENAMP